MARPGTSEFAEQWRDNAYGCFSSGHKFCREVCPVMQVTRNENHTPTAFHASIVAMEQGLVEVEDVADDFVHCTQCGACELRCPNTLFTGDFYRHRTRTVDVVKAMRALMVETGNEREGWKLWNERLAQDHNEPVLGETPRPARSTSRTGPIGLDIPVGGETILFVDCEAAFYRTVLHARLRAAAAEGRRRVRPDARAVVLRRPGGGDGLRRPRAQARRAQRRRLARGRRQADHRARPARLHRLHRGLPEVLPATTTSSRSCSASSWSTTSSRRAGSSSRRPVERTVTYHDPCRLNKRKGVHEAPRELLRAVPGITFHDVDRVTQWSYCSGGGGGLPIEKPEITEEISRRRVAQGQGASTRIDTLVSACPWSERPLTKAGDEANIDVLDLFELVALSAGIEP